MRRLSVRTKPVARRVATLVLAGIVALLGWGCSDEPPPGATRAFECVGLSSARCEQLVRESVGAADLAKVVGASVRCTVPVCSDRSGQVEIIILLADGQRLQLGSAWESPVGAPAEAPPLPVEPTCVGLPEAQCLEQAASVIDVPGAEFIVSIEVRCDGRCTETEGNGKTTVRFGTGDPIVSEWGYMAAE